MLLGDTHGNTKFITNCVIPAAVKAGVEWIYQVGDFGYWEHTSSGVDFIDNVHAALVDAKLQMLFIAGNHDKTSLIFRTYSAIQEFYCIRPGLWFAPNGTKWTIEGKTFVALGGAYSIDKSYRLEYEEQQARKIFDSSRYMNKEYSEKLLWERSREASAETAWFPEEEMTDAEMDNILVQIDPGSVDVILSHDKPLAANPLVKLLPINECIPNQRRLQKAVNHIKPKLLVHGHLHIRYTDTIRCGDNDAYTRVEGLGADVPNFNQTEDSWNPEDAWEILDI
jgi:predicted phosphodiesterase